MIALYLPQYHPIPENDEWWGKGFTEWTNVTKAKPLFPGHLQPKIPADLGFYDLRLPEVREAQADLAKKYGVEGFCYWHYWLGGGRRLLERPFDEVLKSGKPNFPFCLGWANESWTGVWHGAPQRTLIEQRYPGRDDYRDHFYTILPALADPRSINIAGKKLFVIYHPLQIPDCLEFTDLWRNFAEKEGLPGLFFVGIGKPELMTDGLGLDGFIRSVPIPQINMCMQVRANRTPPALQWIQKVFHRGTNRGRPIVCQYKDVIHFNKCETLGADEYPVVIPGWDNTPRSGKEGYVLQTPTPEYFKKMLEGALLSVAERNFDRRVVFLKSWNEWAEGNFVEPSLNDGHGFLEAIRSVIIPSEKLTNTTA